MSFVKADDVVSSFGDEVGESQLDSHSLCHGDTVVAVGVVEVVVGVVGTGQRPTGPRVLLLRAFVWRCGSGLKRR